MPKLKAIPCYVPNGGVHDVVNIPMGKFTRAELKNFCKQLLQSAQQFETMFVATVTPKTLKLLSGLAQLCDIDLKPKSNRRKCQLLTAANEKNLKPSAQAVGNDEKINLVSLSLSLGLITLLFLIAAHLEYLEHLNP